ncbi:hypothetical protein TNCV_883051 [Trichonephila clavipes]|nr:hypothetical protein TNCV_883051 [Trichonephila clavipes]
MDNNIYDFRAILYNFRAAFKENLSRKSTDLMYGKTLRLLDEFVVETKEERRTLAKLKHRKTILLTREFVLATKRKVILFQFRLDAQYLNTTY